MVHRNGSKKKNCLAIFFPYIRWSGFIMDLSGEPGRGAGFGIYTPAGA
jgi:hypothetical protein